MLVQLLSDLHLETEVYAPCPAAEAELLVLAGDIDGSWAGLQQFAAWPVPVLFVAGNHEFDHRELDTARPALRARCAELGITLLECEEHVVTARDGRRVRFLGTTRWSDFDLFGTAGRDRAMRAAGYFLHVMGSTQGGRPFDAAAVRAEALRCRDWLADALRRPQDADATVVITHYGPSVRSVDPRYGHQPGSASFCNDDEALLPLADVWIHGHLHCRHDYLVPHPVGAGRATTRVVSNARGHGRRGEAEGHDGLLCIKL